jgi:hypothetical protein
VIVVLSHNGWTDGGYGYGFTVYGDQTLAKKLNDAGKPVNLIIGGHSHTDVSRRAHGGQHAVVQAHYAGRKVGRADFSLRPDTAPVSVTWSRIVGRHQRPAVHAGQGPGRQLRQRSCLPGADQQPVGYTQVDLLRNYDGDNMMGNFVDDAIYGG